MTNLLRSSAHLADAKANTVAEGDFAESLAGGYRIVNAGVSETGHFQTFGEPDRMSALPPKADTG